MLIQPVILWTDFFMYALIIGITLFWRRIIIFAKKPLAKISLAILMIYLGIGFLDSIHYKDFYSSEVLSVLDYLLGSLRHIDQITYSAPFVTPHHIFGTDKVGQDVFYESLKSIRTGLVIGLISSVVVLPFAIVLGISAGYFGGWIDDGIQYIYTTLSSVPGVLLISAAVLSMQIFVAHHAQHFTTILQGADLRLLALCVILGVTGWTPLCRLLRGEAMKLKQMDFVVAAISLGSSHARIIFKHILPNVMHIVIITTVLDFSGLVLAEAVLSYVGVGVDPTTISWGNMINSARLELAREPVVWWPLASAFLFMFVLVLAANLFADAVRESLDRR